MAKILNISYDGKDYELEYTRRAVREMEADGFRFTEADNQPMTMLPKLFEGAFRAHHRNVKRGEIDEIFRHLPDKSRMFSCLSEMLADTIGTLNEEPEESEGNAVWAPNWEPALRDE